MIQSLIPTGNQMVSLPQIIRETAEIKDITFLHMGYKGLVDIRGDDEKPLMKPFIKNNGKEIFLKNISFERIANWIPKFTLKTDAIELEVTILTPVNERGFVLHFVVSNKTENKLNIQSGVNGRWANSYHCVNEDKRIEGTKHCYKSLWNDMMVFDMRHGTPMFAFAPITEEKCKSEFKNEFSLVDYSLTVDSDIESGEKKEFSIYWGLGFEEVAAVTSAKEMMRRGYEYEFNKTLKFLNERQISFKDEKLTELYNNNLFFCLFYSTGITVDTEELVMVTSRSPRYYVSAAYWDRDSLLWSFPAILDCDKDLAREILDYVFTRQARNFGIHSRYIDGTVLEPGFELDELMAPILALENYINKTGDREILFENSVKSGIKSIIKKLFEEKSDKAELFETFLQPTDDEHVYKYITYDNVLVYKALNAVSEFYPENTEYSFLKDEAKEVKKAIFENCIKEKDGKPFFAWSVDLEGSYDIYDEPAGSLQLLSYLGFCDEEDEVYKNTVEIIRSPSYKFSFAESKFAEIGCPHAPHPWILSVANSLLCKRAESCSNFLHNVKMDSGIACESVDENTGECATGAAFATCAGFLCHAMKTCKERLNQFYEK